MDISISSITPGRNPRRFFDPAELAELESSIKANGILQPILVRPKGENTYEIVAGERRWRAAKAVYGEDGTIPAEIRDMTDDEADAAALIENTLRANMAASEEAEAAYALVTKYKGDRAEVAAQLGWPQSKLSRRLALMEATPVVRNALANREIALGHAELLAAAPKDKQDKVLEKVIANNISVAMLKEQLSAITHLLEAAIFDKTECGGCPNNSSIQAQMFSESVATGRCTHPACFNAKTEARLEAIVAEQREDVPRVEMLRAGGVIETIPVTAKGRMGVGEEQLEACKGCGNYGATVSALAGSVGKIETGQCFDAACHLEKVTAHLKTLAPGPAAKGEAGKTKAKPAAKANQSAAPQRLKDYRVKVWKDALKAEIGKDVFRASAVLIAIAMTGNARNISSHRLGIEMDRSAGSAIGEIFALISGKPRTEMSALLGKLPVAAVEELSETDVCRLLTAMNCDLAEHWVMDTEFLGLLTKSELEALATEVGLKKAMGDALKKALSGKKDAIIAALLKVEGFEYRGAIPASMLFDGGKITKPAKTAGNPAQATTACSA